MIGARIPSLMHDRHVMWVNTNKIGHGFLFVLSLFFTVVVECKECSSSILSVIPNTDQAISLVSLSGIKQCMVLINFIIRFYLKLNVN